MVGELRVVFCLGVAGLGLGVVGCVMFWFWVVEFVIRMIGCRCCMVGGGCGVVNWCWFSLVMSWFGVVGSWFSLVEGWFCTVWFRLVDR